MAARAREARSASTPALRSRHGRETRNTGHVVAISLAPDEMMVAARGARQGEVAAGPPLAGQGGAAGHSVAAFDLLLGPALEMRLVGAAEIRGREEEHGRIEWPTSFEILVPRERSNEKLKRIFQVNGSVPPLGLGVSFAAAHPYGGYCRRALALITARAVQRPPRGVATCRALSSRAAALALRCATRRS
jgi:hypothetical protein